MDKPEQQQQPEPKKQIRLLDIPIADKETASSILTGFLNLAQSRGAFTLEEAHKIIECLSKLKE